MSACLGEPYRWQSWKRKLFAAFVCLRYIPTYAQNVGHVENVDTASTAMSDDVGKQHSIPPGHSNYEQYYNMLHLINLQSCPIPRSLQRDTPMLEKRGEQRFTHQPPILLSV